MSAYDTWEMRLAWQIARQVRGCPPDEQVLAKDPGQNLLDHLEVCAFCQDLRRTGAAVAEEFELARRLPQALENRSILPVGEGQVWSLQGALAGWGPKRLFYNPPLVLILVEATGLGDAMRVAQVYDDLRFTGPGDLPLGEGLFAEAWNTYTLRRCYLDRLIAVVSKEKLQAMLELEAKELPPLDEHTQIKAFRRLELGVGAFFSSRAVSELMSIHHPGLVEFLESTFADEQTVIDQISGSDPGITWPAKKLSLLDALALARFPDDAIPLAAAGHQMIVPVNILRIQAERPGVSLSPGIAVISVWREHQGGLLVGGRLEGALGPQAELTARLELPDGQLRQAAEAILDTASGHFRTMFPEIEAAQLELCLLRLLVLTK